MWRCFMLAVVLALTGKISFGAESAVVDLDYVAHAPWNARKSRFIPRAPICRKCCGRTIWITTNTGEIRFRRDKALWTGG